MVRCDLGRVYGLSNGQGLNAGFWCCCSWFVFDRFFGVWPSEVQMQVAKGDLGRVYGLSNGQG